MEIKDIITLMEAVSANKLTSFQLKQGNTKISIQKNISETHPYPLSATPSDTATQASTYTADTRADYTQIPSSAASDDAFPSTESCHKVVTSPLIGTFYSAASPDAEAFVKVGDSVKMGQTIGIVEAMKLMNEIECEYDGIVDAILVENEATVEYGQPLIRIRLQ